ncbi:hypothetical protein OIU76_019666 [Salix suchowensis]|nr:hypothetical protein OIU76_019666 [Salix suchowensis]
MRWGVSCLPWMVQLHLNQRSTDDIVRPSLVQGVGSPNRVRFQMPGEAQLTEEADQLLDGLGPRFTDWWGYDPLPVDADLLPAAVPGYRRPFRLLPYGVKPTLTNDEMTTLKEAQSTPALPFCIGSKYETPRIGCFNCQALGKM